VRALCQILMDVVVGDVTGNDQSDGWNIQASGIVRVRMADLNGD
jgi:hypothetical protein